MSFVAPLLQTKLYIPPVRHDLVARPRLVERLDLVWQRPLTLISAPPGFGKTTLLIEWIAHSQSGMPNPKSSTAWLSLDDGDNDPTRFFSYVITALQTIDSNLGTNALLLLQSAQPPTLESILTIFLNDIVAFAEPLALVLDDYHIIQTQAIHESLAFLIDHLPPHMHVILTSRIDPPLPLSRLRARGHLHEVRANDLRFTPDEASSFLNQAMGLQLSAEDVVALEARTEGWIAGLQLAALSMRGRSDASAFIEAFTGSNRYILDYLAEEVLDHHTAGTLDFLLQTSILDHLNASLCDAVTAQANSQSILEELDQANLFIIPLDDDRQWYRYHHLFAEVLRARLRQSQPDAIRELHRRAGAWYEDHHFIDESVEHALAADDSEYAAQLIERATRSMIQRGETATLQRWLDALPAELIRIRSRLSLAQAWIALALLKVTEVEAHLQIAEEASAVADDVTRGEIAAMRAVVASAFGDLPRTNEMADRAHELLPTEDLFLRGLVALGLSNLYYSYGQLTKAEQHGADAVASFETTGSLSFELIARTILGATIEEMGRLHEAAQVFRAALQKGQINGVSLPLTGMAVAYLGLGGVLREWHQLDEAEQSFQNGIDLCRQLESLSGVLITLMTGLAFVHRSRGNFDQAIAVLQEAGALMRQMQIPGGSEQADTQLAYTYLLQGDLAAAIEWADGREATLAPVEGESLGQVLEIELGVLAHVRAAQGRWDVAHKLIDHALHSAEVANRRRVQLEMLALRAVVFHKQGQTQQRSAVLERALALGEPGGYVRAFVDEGEPMRALIAALRLSIVDAKLRAYIDTLLAAFPTSGNDRAETRNRTSEIVDPLSERELEVLRLVADGLSNGEISEKLVISIGTVKTHINNLYRKLDATSRTHAVARARTLGLL